MARFAASVVTALGSRDSAGARIPPWLHFMVFTRECGKDGVTTLVLNAASKAL